MSGRGQTGHEPHSRKRELSLKLAVVARRMRMHFDESVQRSGVTRAHWTLVAAVSRIPGATQKSIAKALQISEVSAGRLIDKLCTEGMLKREASAEDRRAYRVSLTARAEPLLDEISVIARRHEDQAFQGLSDDDLEIFARILGIIERNTDTCRDAPADLGK